MKPKISVCIPAYNRARFLPPLLESILSQEYENFEVVVCEDCSPEREAIRSEVRRLDRARPGIIRYYENERNLGYDGNLRNLFDKSSGDYCLIMGNDDLMCRGALGIVASAIGRYDNVGVLIRSYAWFDRSPLELSQTVRYFPDERFFPAGPETVIAFYRRVGAISGIVIHRAEALKYRTDQFDGTLFYQMHLAANILIDMNGVYLPETLVLCRSSEAPDFGNSVAERGKFTPGSYSPSARVYMTKSVLHIAESVERSRKVAIYRRILSDIGNYSYPILAHHAHQPAGIFCRYYIQLAGLGLWSSPLFHFYFLVLLVLGKERANKMIASMRRRLRYTPAMGGLYTGQTSHKQE